MISNRLGKDGSKKREGKTFEAGKETLNTSPGTEGELYRIKVAVTVNGRLLMRKNQGLW